MVIILLFLFIINEFKTILSLYKIIKKFVSERTWNMAWYEYLAIISGVLLFTFIVMFFWMIDNAQPFKLPIND
jgi:hypothetical protein